jgi:hypothetical protein
MNPEARQDGLLTEQVADELVVYDQERKLVHRLNPSSALVWRHCDGTRSITDVAALLREELSPVADEDLVWVALDRLGAANLLREPIRRSAADTRLSRRQVVRKVGRVGVLALLLPVVTTLAVPTPAQAQSGEGCGSS